MPVGSTNKHYDQMSRGELLKEIETLGREKALILLTQSVALRESEDHYRRIIETANEGVWIIDAKGVTSFVNAKMGVILGFHPEEMVGRHLFDFMDEDVKSVAAEKLVHRKMGEKEQHDFPLRCKDGQLVWTQVCTSPILDHDRRYIGALAMVSDITQRKRAEEALWKSEARYRAMINAFDGLMYICSPDYRIEFLNERMKARTGRDATGEHCYQALHELDTICPWCVNERVIAGESVRWEVLSPKDDRWYEVSNSPIHNADGTVSKQAMIIDITDRKQAEAACLKHRIILSQAAKIAHFGAWEWDVTNDVFTLSEEWSKMHGSEATSLSLEGSLALCHPEDRSRIRTAFRAALAGSADFEVNYRVVRNGEELRNFHVLGEVIRDAELRPVGMFGVVRDIT